MAVRFDATADALTRSANLPPNQSFTICGWAVRRVDLNNFTTLFSYRASAAGGVSFVGMNTTSAGDVLRITGTGLTATDLITMTNDVPFFWAATWGASNVVGYTRAVGASTLTSATPSGGSPSFTPGNLCVGNRFAGDSERFNGSIWDVKCWDRQLTEAELLAESFYEAVKFPTSINFWWPLPNSSRTEDLSGNGRNPTVGGTLADEDDIWQPWKPGVQILVPAAAASGDITGTADMVFGAGSSTLTGAGALAGTADNVFGAGSSTLTGVGALAGSCALVFSNSGALVGTSALTGASDLTITPTGTLVGEGALAGTAAITITPTAALVGDGVMAGTAALAFSNSGTLDLPPGALVGAAALTFSNSATLVGTGELLGVSALAFLNSLTVTEEVSETPRRRVGGIRRNYIYKGRKYNQLTPDELARVIQADLANATREVIKVVHKNQKPHKISKDAFKSLLDTVSKLPKIETDNDDDDIEDILALL